VLKSSAPPWREAQQPAGDFARGADFGVVRALLYGRSSTHSKDKVMNADTLVMDVEEVRLSRRWTVWLGRAVSTLPVLMLLASATMKLTHQPMVGGLSKHLGFAESTITGIGLVELACVLLYAIPGTSMLGAVLLTAYLGGAVASHVRVADAFVTPVVIGTLAWIGLVLRDRRLRALLPLRSL
jgi:hypothetical protein